MAMPDIFHWLQGEDVSETYTIQTIMKNVNSTEEGKSLAFRLLIHYYGDIHQPLHSSNRYTAEHPSGDRGGNDFLLKSHDKAKELHAVWDVVVYTLHVNPKRPFNQDSWSAQESIANDLISKFSFDKSDYETVDYPKFRDESFDIAQHVYDGLTEGKDQVLPEEYVDKYAPIAQERVVLAAYRLYYVTTLLFGDEQII